MLEDKLNSMLVSIRNKIDEISMLITGEPETMAQDMIYEELAYYLKSVEANIETLLEMVEDYE